jgi:hypothetical protein
MERSTIKYAVISFTLIAFILFLVNGSVTTHYIKQNTTLNSVKGFTAYNYNGFNYYLDYNYTGSSSDYGTGTLTQNYTLPANYSYYFGFEFSMGSNGNAHANAYYLTNASAKSSYTAPELETYSYSNSDSQIFVYNTLYNNYFQKGYSEWNETRFWLNASATGNSVDSNPIRIDFMVFAFSTQMINVSKLSGFTLNTSDYNYSFSVAKGQFFITINGEPSVDNNILECQNYTEVVSSYQICEAVANGKAWIKTGVNYLEQPILTQKPQSLSFQSNFNYVGSSCLYDYGYEPSAQLTYPFKSNLSVSAVQPITAQTLRYTTSFVLDSGNGGNNYSIPSSDSNASFMVLPNVDYNSINPHLEIGIFRNWYNNILTNVSLNTQNGVLTYEYDNQFFTYTKHALQNLSYAVILNESQLNVNNFNDTVYYITNNAKTYFPYYNPLLNSFASGTLLSYANTSNTLDFFPALLHSNAKGVFNYSTKPLEISFNIPIPYYASSQTLHNLTINKMLFYVYETNGTAKVETIYFGNKTITSLANGTSATFTDIAVNQYSVHTIYTPTKTFQVVSFSMPYNYLLNITNDSGYFYLGIVPYWIDLNYTLQSGLYNAVLPLNLTSNNISVNFISGFGISPHIQEANITKQNGVFNDTTPLEWTYPSKSLINESFNVYLNNALWTSNSYIVFNNKTYRGNPITLEMNTSSTYKLSINVLYNGKYEAVNTSIITASFNPCQPIYDYNNNIKVYVNTSTNVFNTTIIGQGIGNKSTTTIISNSTNTSTTITKSIGFGFGSVSTLFGNSFFRLGQFSFVSSYGFLWLIITFAVLILLGLKLKQKQFAVIGIIFFAIMFFIGALVFGYNPAIFVLGLLAVVSVSTSALIKIFEG